MGIHSRYRRMKRCHTREVSRPTGVGSSYRKAAVAFNIARSTVLNLLGNPGAPTLSTPATGQSSNENTETGNQPRLLHELVMTSSTYGLLIPYNGGGSVYG